MSTVPQLLTDARAHERQRIVAANRRQGTRPDPDYVQATLHAQQALNKRQQAHEFDPDHQETAWLVDTLPHQQQIAWLQAYLSRP